MIRMYFKYKNKKNIMNKIYYKNKKNKKILYKIQQINKQMNNKMENNQIRLKVQKKIVNKQIINKKQTKILEFNVGNEQAVPSSQISRAYGFGTLGLQLAYGAAKELLRTSIGVKQRSGGEGLKGLLLSEENADILTKKLCKMRGAPLKLAQALSIQEEEVIPKHVKEAFERARQSADIMPQYQLYEMMVQELGKDWKEKYFSEFSDIPFAAASIGQVHRAKLLDGTDVAVKIQYPGVKESIDSDLNNLKKLMIYTGLFPKQMFLDKLIDYSRLELIQECDYVEEAKKQEQMRKFLKGDKDYNIPMVIKEISTKRILTSELIQGDSIDYICYNYSQEERNDIGRRLMKLTLRELFEFQTMQTDPNPSNFYFNRFYNKLNLIDFGGVHSYSDEFIEVYLNVIYNATIQNREQIIELSKKLGYLTGEENQTMINAHVQSIITVGEPFAYEGNYDFGNQTLTQRTYQQMPLMLKNRLCPPPQQTYSIHRKLSGAFLISMQIKAKYNCKQLFMDMYQKYQQKKKI
ncbi:hypothetical protein IMG5_144060 [Ichthyophthirius multifiliis]|uniref:ABC1 atypical kinase-like domain-containing protein n=1 Tax=Ichthyophthirius multifiliis TaxID=5932 RepID=G0QXN1_ICHMU|nr:hypothetical protein IMG5_144060 [Ichthyophthirius multifiliis]EGR30031.1 hypothetical protein IMG5_144060 [Ichthyophthirius multifiliis]|eukprot:XP_004031267.1 hypothetical protein IMG5_144060 [Ichthyophthirius multifiliis]